MTLYAVGDLQGCLEPLQRLLDKVNFSSDDELWLTGDLVNRGPDSPGCLRFVKSLGKQAKTVLGNHDLHLLATHFLALHTKDDDIRNTLACDDIDELLAWLINQPMLVQDKSRKLMMTHAGIPPAWSDAQAIRLARELESVLQDADSRIEFFAEMYGNTPKKWRDDLCGFDRLRYIVNAYTRMRFCSANSKLDFKAKEGLKSCPEGMKPWFEWPAKRKHKIIFGHWAALMGETNHENFIGLDTGYVWGNYLTLMNLDESVSWRCDIDGRVQKFTRGSK